MAGRLKWALAIALVCVGTQNAPAQTPEPAVGQEKSDTGAPGTLPMPAAAASGDAPATSFEVLPIRPRLYADADYLLWWVRRGNLPEQPLVTTGVQTPANASTVGIVGQPGTQTLFGQNSLVWNVFSGANLTIGYNFSADEAWGVEARGFILPKQTINYNFSGTGTPLVTRPIFDNFNKLEATYDVSSVDATGAPIVSGSLNIQATAEFWGYEFNLMRHVFCTNGANLDLYVGFRSLALDETLQFQSASVAQQANIVTFLGNPVNVGDTVTAMDFFGTTNRFYGAQVGCGFNKQCGRLEASLIGKVAAGVNHEGVTINGESTWLPSGQPLQTATGGILAQGTNIGVYNRNVFCLAPELGLQLSYDITSWLRFRLGFNVIYWSSVVRPGSQIDRSIDTPQVPLDQAFGKGTSPPARPAFAFRDTDFWAEGFNLGLEFRY